MMDDGAVKSIADSNGDAEDNTTTAVDGSSEDKAMATASGDCPELASKSNLPSASNGAAVGSRSKRTRCRRSGGQTQGVMRGQKNRRRGRTKNRKRSVNWQLPTEQDLAIPPYPLVPYNTNRFLMEYHMAEVSPGGAPVGRDEFLSNEFSNVYETAKCERLEGLSKQQLIQEYLQLESSHEQLKQRQNAQSGKAGASSSGGSHNHHNRAKWESHWRALKDQVRRLTADNNQLRAKLMQFNGGDNIGERGEDGTVKNNNVDDSVDSESDSSVSSISSRSASRSSSSSSSSSGSGSCCSSRCSSRDSAGNVLPSRRNSDAEMVANESGHNDQEMAMQGVGPQAENNATDRPVNNHHRHRTHRQRRNSRLHQHQIQPTGSTVENGHMEET